MDRGVLRENGDAALALELVAVHRALGDALVRAERAALVQHRVDERGLAVIDVGDDGDVAAIRVGDRGRISRRRHPISIVAVSSQLQLSVALLLLHRSVPELTLKLMFKRQTTGSVVCSSCGSLVGVRDEKCYNCGRRNPGLWGFAPLLRSLGNDLGFVQLVIWGCGALYVISLLLSRNAMRMGGGLFGFLAPDLAVLFLLGASGGRPVFEFGWWWTVFSASWLHGSLLHIIFNMMWVRDLGPVVADMFGAGRMVIIYTVAGASGFLLSSFAYAFLPHLPFLSGAGVTVGASASVFGFLGALVYYGRRTGSSLTRSEAIRYALILGFFGFIMRGVDNFAHAGGFFGGYLAARLLDPLKPERIDHIVIALICIAAAFLSIAASVVTVLPILTSQ